MLALLLCAGCHSDSEPDDGPWVTGDYPQYEDFRASMINDAGGGATDCGHAPRDADRQAIHCCMIEHFEAGTPAFATYAEPSIDSYSVHGVTTDGSGGVSIFWYDYYSQNPQMQQDECQRPYPKNWLCRRGGDMRSLPLGCFPPN